MRFVSRRPGKKQKYKTLNAFIIIIIVHERFISFNHFSRNWGLSSLGDLRAEIGTNDGDQTAEPPSEARIARLQAQSVEESRKSRAESSTQASRGRRDAVDRAENLLRRGRVRQKNCVAWVCHCRKSALPNDQEINGGHPQALWEEHYIRRNEVEGKVGKCNEAK